MEWSACKHRWQSGPGFRDRSGGSLPDGSSGGVRVQVPKRHAGTEPTKRAERAGSAFPNGDFSTAWRRDVRAFFSVACERTHGAPFGQRNARIRAKARPPSLVGEELSHPSAGSSVFFERQEILSHW